MTRGRRLGPRRSRPTSARRATRAACARSPQARTARDLRPLPTLGGRSCTVGSCWPPPPKPSASSRKAGSRRCSNQIARRSERPPGKAAVDRANSRHSRIGLCQPWAAAIASSSAAPTGASSRPRLAVRLHRRRSFARSPVDRPMLSCSRPRLPYCVQGSAPDGLACPQHWFGLVENHASHAAGAARPVPPAAANGPRALIAGRYRQPPRAGHRLLVARVAIAGGPPSR